MGDYNRIMMTGGTGFAGGYVAEALAVAYPTAERVILHRAGPSVRLPEGWTGIEGDIAEPLDVDAAVRQVHPDLILHLAAKSSVTDAAASTWRVNHGGTVSIAEAVRRHVPHATVFFTSSAEVYGDSFRQGPVDEGAPLLPLGDYGRAKVAAEKSLCEILPDTSRLLIARAFNHTGPLQTTSFVLPMLASQVADIEAGRRAPVVRMGNLEPQRDFMHVLDVSAAYIALLRLSQSLALGGVAGPANTFNVASGVSHRIGDLVAMFLERTKIRISVEIDLAKARANEVMEVSGVIEKITRMTGWHPKIPIETIVDDLLNYWRHRPSLDPASQTQDTVRNTPVALKADTKMLDRPK